MCKIQYVEKSKICNIRLNNHRKNIEKPNAIEACKHFNNNEVTLKLRLRERDNFWIEKLKTLISYGLNQELN